MLKKCMGQRVIIIVNIILLNSLFIILFISEHAGNLCNKRFSRKHSLIRHMHVHEEPEPYVCPGHNRAFVRFDRFVIHLKTYHREIYDGVIAEMRNQES